MVSVPFIDIHTHSIFPETDTVTVRNIFPGGKIGRFTGKNFYSVGLHPWYIKSEEENNEMLCLVEDALELDHVIFVGETGPDAKASTGYSEQMRVFEAQAFMAEEFHKPLLIHCVKAYNEVIRVYNKLHPEQPWILHGYNGNLEITQQLADKNILFSFGEILFKPEAKAIESFQFLPFDRMFFETDESTKDVAKIYEQGAALKNTNVEELKIKIWENFNRIENVKWLG